jgi:uncharacterized protein HemX
VRRVLVLLTLVACLLAPAPSARAQDSTSTSTTIAVPSQDIVPQPNSGTPPQEAGDRGGALQLGLLALVVVAIGAAVAGLVRQSKRSRAR